MAVLTEEQQMLREAAKDWVTRRSPIRALRNLRDRGADLGYEPAVWTEMAAMGWAGTIVPEKYGGSNLGCMDLALVLEELGRTLTASPLIASGLAGASALMLGGSAGQKQAWLPRVADGTAIVTLAVDEHRHHNPQRVETQVVDGRLSGEKVFVIEGMAAHLFVVSARSAGTLELYLVRADAGGVSRQRLSLADSRGAANLTFKDVVVSHADRLSGGAALLDKVLDRGRAGISAEMLGSACQAFDMTLDYLKTRVQFDQPIGSFQALQHRAAKMFTELELSRSAVEAACMAIDADSPDRAALVSLAKVKVGDTFHLVSNEMVQMHGGIAMTDAHDAGFYLKRARAAEAAFGNQAFHRDRYARCQGY